MHEYNYIFTSNFQKSFKHFLHSLSKYSRHLSTLTYLSEGKKLQNVEKSFWNTCENLKELKNCSFTKGKTGVEEILSDIE